MEILTVSGVSEWRFIIKSWHLPPEGRRGQSGSRKEERKTTSQSGNVQESISNGDVDGWNRSVWAATH